MRVGTFKTRNRSRWLFIACAATLPWLASECFARPYEDLKRLCLFTLLGVLLATVRKVPRVPAVIFYGACAYAMAAAVSLLFQAPAYDWFLRFSEGLLCVAASFVLATSPRRWLDRLTTALAWSFALVAVVTIAVLSEWTVLRSLRSGSSFAFPMGNTTYFGDAMAVALPLFLFLSVRARSRRVRMLAWTGAAIVFCGVVASGSRGSFLAAASAAVVWWFLHRRNVSRALAGITVAAALAAIILCLLWTTERGTSTRDRWTSLSELGQRSAWNGASSGREAAFLATIERIRERPWFGYGLGSFRYVYGLRNGHAADTERIGLLRWWEHPQNELLHQLTEVGVAGVLALLFLFGATVHLSRRLRRPMTSTEVEFRAAAIAGGIALAVSWSVSSNFLHPVSRLLAVVWVGFFFRTLPLPMDHYRTPFGRIPWRSLALAAAAIVVSNGVAQWVWILPRSETTAKALAILAPGSFETRSVAAQFALHRQTTAESKEAVDRLVLAYPRLPFARYLLARQQVREGSWGEAEGTIRWLEHFDPGSILVADLRYDYERLRKEQNGK